MKATRTVEIFIGSNPRGAERGAHVRRRMSGVLIPAVEAAEFRDFEKLIMPLGNVS